MSEHAVRIEWQATNHATKAGTYSRDHVAVISPEVRIPVSAAADYLGSAGLADPEQLLVNALASCHMLYFLAICEGSGYEVLSYEDNAVGTVSKGSDGAFSVSSIVLNPKAVFSEKKQPNRAALERMHDRAHAGCFIANSIKSNVTIEIA